MELVSTELRDGIAIVRLNDPGTLNAFSEAMFESLNDAITCAEAEARVMVFTGAGRGFSSGANLTTVAVDVPAAERDAGRRLEKFINPLMLRLRDLNIPFLTAVNGPAAGLGCALALAGDLVIAAESAYFLQPFSQIGFIPDGGSAYILAASAGRVRALEMMLLGERLPAAKALEWGLINRVVADTDLMPAALAWAGRLAGGPATALGLIRKMAWLALDYDFAQQLQFERAGQRLAGRDDDFDEGVAAFREKRAPRFGRMKPLTNARE